MNIYIYSFIFIISFSFSNNKINNIAFCLESKGEVSRKGFTRKGNLYKGDIIYDGDKITVGNNGFISFLNIYERSQIKVFENSSLKIFSNKKDNSNECEIAIFGGKVIIDKMELNEIRLILKSPSSSVYSKNSHFFVEYKSKPLFNDISYCIFTIIEGNILIENLESERSIFLNSGDTVISTKEGKFLQLDTFRDGFGVYNTLNSIIYN